MMHGPVEEFTARERQVLALIAQGKSTKQVAAELGITFKTAACHRYRILAKSGAVNAVELVLRAASAGLIAMPTSAREMPLGVRKSRSREELRDECRNSRESLLAAVQKSGDLREDCD